MFWLHPLIMEIFKRFIFNLSTQIECWVGGFVRNLIFLLNYAFLLKILSKVLGLRPYFICKSVLTQLIVKFLPKYVIIRQISMVLSQLTSFQDVLTKKNLKVQKTEYYSIENFNQIQHFAIKQKRFSTIKQWRAQ